LQRELDVKVEIVDFPNDTKYQEFSDLYGKSLYNKGEKDQGSPVLNKYGKYKSKYNHTVI